MFGDIGTSPLYTLKEAFSPHYGLVANHDTVLGILSLVFWALMIVVTLKYVTIIMRADNEGEGGIMALMALAQRSLPKGSRSAYVVGILGIFGAVAVLRRRRDHAGDHRAVGGRGPGGRGAASCMRYIVPITLRGAGGAVRDPALRHREGRQGVRAGDGAVVRRRWRLIGVLNIVPQPGGAPGAQSVWGVRFFVEHGWHGDASSSARWCWR